MKLLALVGAVVVVAITFMLLGPGSELVNTVEPRGAPVDAMQAPAVLVDEGDPNHAEPIVIALPQKAQRETVTLVAVELANAAENDCVVMGRVVNEHGDALAQVPLELVRYEPWADGVVVPLLDGSPKKRGFIEQTDKDGVFRFEVPVPSSGYTVFEVKPDRFRDSHKLVFDPTRRGAQLPLVAGERDLGTIVLGKTGAVSGRVVDESGAPIADVKMGTGPDSVYTYGRGARSAIDGSYLIGHAVVGTYGVLANAKGYLREFQEPVVVAAGRETTGVDFVLKAAPRISGMVVDEYGQGVEAARLVGWPVSSGASAVAKSDVDGSFVLFLPQDEAYVLEVTCKGFESRVGSRFSAESFEPGTSDLRIEIHSLPEVQFKVVDDETGEPVERFGLTILKENGSESKANLVTIMSPPPIKDQPGGLAMATGREGIDLYLVAAEGYLAGSGDVAHDQEGADAPVQTVRLKRGIRAVGRVLSQAGEPMAQVPVSMKRGWYREPGVFQASSSDRFKSMTDDAGRFEIGGLPVGQFRVDVTPIGAPALKVVVKLEPGSKQQDLGDLRLTAGASLAGHVLLPQGVSPQGLIVYLGGGRDAPQLIVDGNGDFHGENLASGTLSLWLGGRPGQLASMALAGVDLVAGETSQAVIDASDQGVCEVTLTVDLGGLDVAGVQVNLVSSAGDHERESLGKCDADGQVTGFVRAWGQAEVSVHLPGLQTVTHPHLRLDLVGGESVRADVLFGFASLEVRLPEEVSMPENGHVSMTLTAPGAQQEAQIVFMRFDGGQRVTRGGELVTNGAHHLSYQAALGGRYSMKVEFVDNTVPEHVVQIDEKRKPVTRAPYYSAVAEVVLVAGQAISVTLD